MMEWEILSVRCRVKGGCYSITMTHDADKGRAYLARYCVEPRSSATLTDANLTRTENVGHAKDLFEATEICKRDAFKNGNL